MAALGLTHGLLLRLPLRRSAELTDRYYSQLQACC